jgi:hypothetical protein
MSSLENSKPDNPTLDEAHLRSLNNRQVLAGGGKCGCFHCLATFDADQVTEWVDEGSTALCPRCHIDTVLSARADSIDQMFLRRMRDFYFESCTRINAMREPVKLQKPDKPEWSSSAFPLVS